MGFFQDLKEDLSQAVNELMPENAHGDEEIIEKEAQDDTTMDEMLRDVEAALSMDFDFEDGIVEGSELVEKASDFAIDGTTSERNEAGAIDAAAMQLAGIANIVAREEVQKANEVKKTTEVTTDVAENREDEKPNAEPEKDVQNNVINPPQWQSFLREKHKAEEEAREKAAREESAVVENDFLSRVAANAQKADEKNLHVGQSKLFRNTFEATNEEKNEQPFVNVKAEEAQTQIATEQNMLDRTFVSPKELLRSMPKDELEKPMQKAVSRQEQNVAPIKEKKASPSFSLQLEGEAPVDETAHITAGMTITGDVLSKGNLDIFGEIHGNIEILGRLNVAGKIYGDSAAADIVAQSANITGNVKAAHSVQIGLNSVVIGDIVATSAVIAGAVKGNLDIKGPVILDNSAVIMGNIKSKSVEISSGAIVEGMCSQCYADVKASAFFE